MTPFFAERTVANAIHQTCLVVDTSRSMGFVDWKPTRLAGAQEAALAFLEVKRQRYPRDQIAIVSFADEARYQLPLTEVEGGFSTIRSVLKSLTVSPNTNIPAGLDLAASLLYHAPKGPVVPFSLKGLFRWFFKSPKASAPAPQKVLQRVLLLTDGVNYPPRPGESVRSAQQLKGYGVEIDVVGIGGVRAEVNEEELKQVASLDSQGRPRYRYIGEKSNLIREFKRIANCIEEVRD